MLRRFGLPILAATLLIACATFLVASRDFDDASVELVQVRIPLSVTQKLRHAVRRQPRDPAAYWPVFPQLYSINMVNGRIVGEPGGVSAAAATSTPMLERIRAAKLLKEKVSSMLQDAVNINSQAKALRSQAGYAQQQAADVKAEESALRSKIIDVSTNMKTEHATIDALSSKANGLSTNSQWAAKQGVADLALAQKMEAKVKSLRQDTRKISDTLSDLDDTVHHRESKLVDARSDVATQQQKLESDHLKVARLRKRLSRYFLERKQAQDRSIAAHAAALTDKTRIAAVVDRLHVLSKEHDRLSDSRDNLKDIVDTLSDKVSDAKGKADDLQQKIQDVKYEEHDKLETARIGY